MAVATRLWWLTITIASLLTSPSLASPWIVTANYEAIVTVEPGFTDREYSVTEAPSTYTEIATITSPTGAPISTSTITETDDYSEDTVTIVEVLYPYNSAYTASDEYYATVTTGENVYTSFVVNVTYTAPTGCSSTWTYTTAIYIDPPYQVQDALVPVATSTSLYIDNSSPFQPTTITEIYAYVDPTQVPSSSLSVLSSEYAPYPSCYNPTSSSSDSGDDNGDDDDSDSSSSSGIYSCGYYMCSSDDGGSWINDSSYYGISPLAIILITVLGWTFIIFVAGLFENYYYFRRLMMGWAARRGLPIIWMLWLFPFSLLVCVWFSRRGYQARSEAEAKELTQKWKETGFWEKKLLWLRHGFGSGYPAVLGAAPPRVGQPAKTAAAAPTQPLLTVSPPQSETADLSRAATPRTTATEGDTDVENAAAAAAPRLPEVERSGGVSPQNLVVPSLSQSRSPDVSGPSVPGTSVAREDEIAQAPDAANTETRHGDEAADKQASEKQGDEH